MMNQNLIAEYFVIWNQNLKPPADNPQKYDMLLHLELVTKSQNVSTSQQLLIVGQVHWDDSISGYVFQVVKQKNIVFEPCILVLPSHIYLEIRSQIRNQIGVYTTRGLVDEQEWRIRSSKKLH